MLVNLKINGVEEMVEKVEKAQQALMDVRLQLEQLDAEFEIGEKRREEPKDITAFLYKFPPDSRITVALSGARSMEELCGMSVSDLLSRYGIGKRQLAVLAGDLDKMGYRLREEQLRL